MRVRASSPARQDLRLIVEFIARDNPSAARRVRAAIRQRIESLADQPERGTVVMHDQRTDLRRLVTGPFLIFYLIQDRTILVTRILRGSRDVVSELRLNPGRPGASG